MTALTLVLSAAMLLGANYIVSKTIAWTPGGYGLAFGRMLQDGIVTRYLNDHCPTRTAQAVPVSQRIAARRRHVPVGQERVQQLGRFAGLGDEMRTIVLGSLRDYPAMQAETALRATARQLVEVSTGEGIVTTLWHTYGIIERYTPSVVPAMQAARQQHGEIGFASDQHDRRAGGLGGDGAASRSYCCLASTAPNSPTSAGSPRHCCWRSSAMPSSAASYRIRTIATARASSGPRSLRSRSRRRAPTRWSGADHDPEKWFPVFGKDHGQMKILPLRRESASTV